MPAQRRSPSGGSRGPARGPSGGRPRQPSQSSAQRGGLPALKDAARGARRGAAGYQSSNIAGEQPAGVAYGGYNQGSTLDQIKRNEYLNTLPVDVRAMVMNRMGYWTGGVPVRPGGMKAPSKAYMNALGLKPGETYQFNQNGVYTGQVTNNNGKLVFQAFGSGQNKQKGKGKGGGKRGNRGGGVASGGPPVDPGTGNGGSAVPASESFTTGVSGATGAFIKEFGGSGPGSDTSEGGGASGARRKKQTHKLVRRVAKKSTVSAKRARRTLKGPVTKADQKVYKQVARSASPKLANRLRAADRRSTGGGKKK